MKMLKQKSGKRTTSFLPFPLFLCLLFTLQLLGNILTNFQRGSFPSVVGGRKRTVEDKTQQPVQEFRLLLRNKDLLAQVKAEGISWWMHLIRNVLTNVPGAHLTLYALSPYYLPLIPLLSRKGGVAIQMGGKNLCYLTRYCRV